MRRFWDGSPSRAGAVAALLLTHVLGRGHGLPANAGMPTALLEGSKSANSGS